MATIKRSIIRIYISETGDAVQLEDKLAEKYGLVKGDSISMSKWREIIASDFHDTIMRFGDGISLSPSQNIASRLWIDFAKRLGFEVTFNDLTSALIKPKACDTFIVLLASEFLRSETNLMTMLWNVLPPDTDEDKIKRIRYSFIEYADNLKKSDIKKVRQLCKK